MKSCKSNSKKCNDIKYPCLMEGPISGVIVLMVSRSKGTVVCGVSNLGHRVGDYRENWSSNMKPYNGSVTLENDSD